jgi:ferric-dicitrate binding protein FerR (iron transport regulator)
MSRDRETRRYEQERAGEAVRGLTFAAPAPHFRERLKSDFVSGRLAATEVVRRPARRVRWWWALAPAAAAVLAIALLARGPRVPVWTVRAASAESAQVDGRELALEPGRSLPGGGKIRVTGGWLEMNLGDMLAMQINAGSEVELPALIEHDPGTLDVHVARGEVLFLTGETFPGTTLNVETPEGRIEVTGTAFALYRDADVTCVCVLEGRARVGVGPTDLEIIVPGKRKVMFSDGRPPKILDIEPQHREGVEAFVRRARSEGKS